LGSSERVKLSEGTLVGLDELLKRLREVKARGYAVSDGENAYQLRTVAAPVFDAEGHVTGGVSMTVDGGRMSIDSLIQAAVPKILQIAADFSEALRLSAGAISL